MVLILGKPSQEDYPRYAVSVGYRVRLWLKTVCGGVFHLVLESVLRSMRPPQFLTENTTLRHHCVGGDPASFM